MVKFEEYVVAVAGREAASYWLTAMRCLELRKEKCVYLQQVAANQQEDERAVWRGVSCI